MPKVKFQSLFYWKSYCNHLHLLHLQRIFPVSILVLLEVLLQQDGVVNQNPEEVGFNPCFTGSLTATTTPIKKLYNMYNVSILVLLEVLLQP